MSLLLNKLTAIDTLNLPAIMKKLQLFIMLILALTLFSCGTSVVFTSTRGVPNPDMNEYKDFFRDKYTIEIDTVMRGATTASDLVKASGVGCESGKIFAVEFKQSFGSRLWSFITFGSRRRITLRYVCMQDL